MPRISVKVVRAVNLTTKSGPGGTIEAYVKLKLGKQKNRKTKMAQGCDPEFNQLFDYSYWPADNILTMAVWNNTANEDLGSIQFEYPSDPSGRISARLPLAGGVGTGMLEIEITNVATRAEAAKKGGAPDEKAVVQPEHDEGEVLMRKMKAGEKYLLYKNGRETEVMLHWSEYGGVMGEMIWVLPGKSPETAADPQRLPMHTITDVFVGFPCPHSKEVNASDICLSMKGKGGKQFDLIALTLQSLEQWLNGIKYILMSRGKKVVQNDAAAAPAAAPEAEAEKKKKGRRFTVTGQNPVEQKTAGPTYLGDDSTPQLKMMCIGCEIKVYTNDASPVVTPMYLFFSKNGGKFGSLYWCDRGVKVEDPSRCLLMHELTDIYVGKQQPIFKHPIAKEVEDQKCFSVVSKKNVLHIESASVQVMKDWMVGINHVLTSTGRKVVLENEAGEKKATPAGRRFSRHFSVAVRSKTTHKGVLKMAKGALFNRYRQKKSRPDRSVKTQVFVFHSRLVAQEGMQDSVKNNAGALFWYEKKAGDDDDDKKQRDRSCMPIHSITDVFLGKQERIFYTPAANAAVEDCVISIVGVASNKRGKMPLSLHLEAEDAETAQEWLESITHLLKQVGKDVDEDAKMSEEAAAQAAASAPTGGAKKGKRMSVVAPAKVDPKADPFDLLGSGQTTGASAYDNLENFFPESRPENPFAAGEEEEVWDPLNGGVMDDEEDYNLDPFADAGFDAVAVDPNNPFGAMDDPFAEAEKAAAAEPEAKKAGPTVSEQASLTKLDPVLVKFLTSVGLVELAPIFAADMVDMETLRMFSRDDLKDLGIKVGPIVKILKTLPTWKE